MKQVDIAALRAAIGKLDDSARQRQKELASVAKALEKDIEAARARGVSWAKLAAAISAKMGRKVTGDQLRSSEKKNTAKQGKAPAKGKSSFIVAAATPNGKLYQLEHSSAVNGKPGGGYRIYEVGEDGEMSPCGMADFPASIMRRDIAVEQFKAWAKGREYEIYGGEYRP